MVYMSGKKMILPASEAAIDACERMGRRKFMDQLVEDTVQQVSGIAPSCSASSNTARRVHGGAA